jgi:hypothetical protein
MTKQLSFSAYERRVLPRFREKMNKAESTEDVQKAFVQTVEALLNNVLEGRVRVHSEDLLLLPHTEPHYRVSEGLRADELLKSYWNESDLPRVINRFAESAIGRHKHLEKHPEKTELKIRM